jgi:hypothetical protein
MGQKAALALDWSEQMELNPDPEKTKASGRPKEALPEAAKCIGINEKRVFDRQIRDADPRVYKGVKAARRSFTSALTESIERLTPDDEIRALHTRAVANGEKWYRGSVGDFGNVVVWGRK